MKDQDDVNENFDYYFIDWIESISLRCELYIRTSLFKDDDQAIFTVKNIFTNEISIHDFLKKENISIYPSNKWLLMEFLSRHLQSVNVSWKDVKWNLNPKENLSLLCNSVLQQATRRNSTCCANKVFDSRALCWVMARYVVHLLWSICLQLSTCVGQTDL